jgi:CHAT domain-containing protein
MVHLATHGIMNSRNPMFSRIELAPGRGGANDDGRLEVHELLGLRIGAPLVFLSGCETGVGTSWSTQFARGEDYATLAQAFLYAGARTVAATLWQIGDDGAAVFAERFYAQLRTMAPAEALAAAQREMLRGSRYASPYYWAGYQVIGESEPLGPHRLATLSVERR